MNSYDELKLAIYESGLDWENCETMIDALESCDYEDEFLETVDDVLEILEATKEEIDRKVEYNRRKAKFNNSEDIKLARSAGNSAEIRGREEYSKRLSNSKLDEGTRRRLLKGVDYVDKVEVSDAKDKLAGLGYYNRWSIANSLKKKHDRGALKSKKVKDRFEQRYGSK